MHHTVRYDTEGDPAAAEVKAMQDVEAWLGDRYSVVEATLKTAIARGCPLDEFQIAVSFVGIQGYPAKVWYQKLGGTIQ